MTPKPTVYISSPYELRAYAIELREGLRAAGIAVVARWMDDEVPDYDPLNTAATVDRNARWANHDLEDLSLVDAVVSINPDAWKHKGSGGRHVETGYALNCGIPIIIVGARTNVFHYLPGVEVVSYPADIPALAGRLQGLFTATNG